MSLSSASPGFTNQRRSDRDEVFLRTEISAGKKTGISAQVVNVSAHGFMARTSEVFVPNSKISVLLPYAGELGASVIWSLGGRIGCQFDTPIAEHDYPKLLAAIKNSRPNWQFSHG